MSRNLPPRSGGGWVSVDEMSVDEIRKIYDALVARFGKTSIDGLLCPCWDPDLVHYYVEPPTLKHRHVEDLPTKKEYPYQDFVFNLEWFLDILRERGKWPLTETIQTEVPCNERRGEIDE